MAPTAPSARKGEVTEGKGIAVLEEAIVGTVVIMAAASPAAARAVAGDGVGVESGTP
jgi:hypothetical protein